VTRASKEHSAAPQAGIERRLLSIEDHRKEVAEDMAAAFDRSRKHAGEKSNACCLTAVATFVDKESRQKLVVAYHTFSRHVLDVVHSRLAAFVDNLKTYGEVKGIALLGTEREDIAEEGRVAETAERLQELTGIPVRGVAISLSASIVEDKGRACDINIRAGRYRVVHRNDRDGRLIASGTLPRFD
jgi:hypothetical protein